MQPAADLVAAAAKFSSCVQDGHDHFKRGEAGTLVMLLDRDAAPIIFNSHRAVGMDGDNDGIGKTGHHFVDAVIDNFIDQVV